MVKKAFVNVTCPKCSRKYAILKGSLKEFHCPGKNCHAVVNKQNYVNGISGITEPGPEEAQESDNIDTSDSIIDSE